MPTLQGSPEHYLLRLYHQRKNLSDSVSQHTGRFDSDIYRCIAHWTDAEIDVHRDTLLMLQQEYQQLLEDHQKIRVAREQGCSQRRGGWLVGPAAQSWADCNMPANQRMRDIEKRLRILQILND